MGPYILSFHSSTSLTLTTWICSRNELSNDHERRIAGGGSERDSPEVFPGDLDLGLGAPGVSSVLPGI